MTQPEPSSPPHQVSSTATDAKDSRVHDRLVRHFESHPLRDFQNAAELMTVTHEAYKAHRSVYEGHGYIHGDVSDQTVTLTIQDGVRGDALIDLDCGKNFTYVDVLKSTDVFKDILSDGITMDSGKANATNSETDAELASMLRFFGM
ncbi:hypothetical protein PLICRDRAFT_176605 [Plicaturopsis crispa FD-325 SS-3]|nr:hypothetical protein PLICRDRAFT_176605 [Plicaturopsis crispa FD-325 SS-3]